MPEITPKNRVPVAVLRERLLYKPKLGKLFWKKRPGKSASIRSWNTRWAGKEAGTWTAKGYPMVQVLGCILACHRVAWALHYGKWPDSELDHRDRAKPNFKIKNLRPATRALQTANTEVQPYAGKYARGVLFHKFSGRWRAYYFERGKQKSLGYFATMEEAQRAREDHDNGISRSN